MSKNIRGHNVRDDWETPPEILELVRRVAPVALDPCTTRANPTGAQSFYWQDGLTVDWRSFVDIASLAYVNPPYHKAWYQKIEEEMLRGTPMIALLMAKPGAKWFQSLTQLSHAVCFWRGRLIFIGAPTSAPFDSALLYHGPHPNRFRSVFSEKGWIV